MTVMTKKSIANLTQEDVECIAEMESRQLSHIDSKSFSLNPNNNCWQLHGFESDTGNPVILTLASSSMGYTFRSDLQ